VVQTVGGRINTAFARPDVATAGLVLLDELNIVLRYDYLSVDEVVAFLRAEKPAGKHGSSPAATHPRIWSRRPT
jgi:ATP:corrinoid adenosyltransferase